MTTEEAVAWCQQHGAQVNFYTIQGQPHVNLAVYIGSHDYFTEGRSLLDVVREAELQREAQAQTETRLAALAERLEAVKSRGE